MQHLKILNKKEKKQITAILEEQYGIIQEIGFVFLLSKKNKLYLINNDLARIDLTKLKIDSIGMYLGELVGNQIRLSIEGSQLLGKHATKNIVNLDKNIAKLWLHGYNLELSAINADELNNNNNKSINNNKDMEGFVIIKSENDYLGSGKLGAEKLFNYVSKARRLRSSD
ncbi:hypothetical protein HZA96_05025 [Candidatus Woesearchaeota archaeon]|nr:hypothetical protein [Candidatus Woesearchaeota archaeon]